MHAPPRRQRLMAPCSIRLIGCWQNGVQFFEDAVSEGFKFGEQVLGQIRKAEKVILGNNQRVLKDKVAQGRLGIEILRLIDDFVLWIRRGGHLLYRTKQAIHSESPS